MRMATRAVAVAAAAKLNQAGEVKVGDRLAQEVAEVEEEEEEEGVVVAEATRGVSIMRAVT